MGYVFLNKVEGQFGEKARSFVKRFKDSGGEIVIGIDDR